MFVNWGWPLQEYRSSFTQDRGPGGLLNARFNPCVDVASANWLKAREVQSVLEGKLPYVREAEMVDWMSFTTVTAVNIGRIQLPLVQSKRPQQPASLFCFRMIPLELARRLLIGLSWRQHRRKACTFGTIVCMARDTTSVCCNRLHSTFDSASRTRVVQGHIYRLFIDRPLIDV